MLASHQLHTFVTGDHASPYSGIYAFDLCVRGACNYLYLCITYPFEQVQTYKQISSACLPRPSGTSLHTHVNAYSVDIATLGCTYFCLHWPSCVAWSLLWGTRSLGGLDVVFHCRFLCSISLTRHNLSRLGQTTISRSLHSRAWAIYRTLGYIGIFSYH